jgi:hypothetical protein
MHSWHSHNPLTRSCLLSVLCCLCRYYNTQSTPYYQCAVKLQSYMDNYLDATVTEATAQQQQQQQQQQQRS